MNEINSELLDWILSIDESEEVYARTYGSFSMSRMDFNLFITDEEMEKFDQAEKSLIDNNGTALSEEIEENYFRYIQAHNHELFHYYQALALPAFSIYQKLNKAKTEFDAAIMLRFFEYGFSYTFGENKNILDSLKYPEFRLPDEEIKNFNSLYNKYKFFVEEWKAEYNGISLFHIVEGMAHIMSIQLTPYSKNYLPDTKNNPDYNIAFDKFYNSIDKQYKDIDIRVKHITFLYICFFSCQTYSLAEDKVHGASSRLFHLLCSRLNTYLQTFLLFLDKCRSYPESKLRQLKQFNIDQEAIKLANKDQLSQIYAFYELIPIIEQDAKEFYRLKNDPSLIIAQEFLDVLKSLDIDLSNKYQLANFALFPSKMADMWEAYDIIQQSTIGENKFNSADESAFFELMGSCKNLLNDRITWIACCSEHGLVSDRNQILSCPNNGGLAFFLKELTGRNAFDLFKIPKVM